MLQKKGQRYLLLISFSHVYVCSNNDIGLKRLSEYNTQLSYLLQ